jgi:hypothetical protein
MQKVSNDAKQWQRESDARTLAEAETIKSDPKRFGGAKKEAVKLQGEHQKQAQALSKIVKTPVKGGKK